MRRSAANDRELGVEPLEPWSDHPTFDARRKQLATHFDVNRPSAGPFVIYCFVVETGTKGTTEVGIPLASAESEGMYLAAWQDAGGKFALIPFERVDGTIHLYLRDEAKSQEIIIHNPDVLTPDVTHREIRLVDRSVSERKPRAIQLAISSFSIRTWCYLIQLRFGSLPNSAH